MNALLIAILLSQTISPPPGVAIQDEGSAQGRAQTINCAGAGVTCATSGAVTTMTIPGGSGSAYATVQDEGSPLTQRTILNFTGTGVACVDNGGSTRTDCTINAGGGASPSYYGSIAGARGQGDPADLMALVQKDVNIAATPTNISVTVARISFFRLPFNLTVNRIRFYGVGATTNVYRVALYSYNVGSSTGTRLTAELPFTTAANTWGAAGSALNVTLTAGTLYFIAVSVNATGTTPGVSCWGDTVAATTGQIATAPQSLPGNLDADAGFLNGYNAQFAVTAGALPATTGTLAAQAAWAGGMPAFWLDNSNL